MKFSKLVNYVIAATVGLQLPLLQIQNAFASPAPTVVTPSSNSSVTRKPKPPEAKPKKPTLLSRNDKYGFSCSGTTTIFSVKKGSQAVKKVPLIEWTDAGAEQFGGNYTAESRCKTVSSRFKTLMIMKKSKLRNPLPQIRVGKLNGVQVICASKGSCTDKNLLWTLKTENAANAKNVLRQLVSTIKNPSLASGKPAIFESDDQPDSQMESADGFDTEELLAAAVSNFESDDSDAGFESDDSDAGFESDDSDAGFESDDSDAGFESDDLSN